MTPEAFRNLRALAEKATPGPWSNDDGKRGPKKSVWTARSHIEREDPFPTYPGEPSRYGPDRDYLLNAVDPWPTNKKDSRAILNASFIAACDPTTVLAMLDEIDALRGAIASAWMEAKRSDFDINHIRRHLEQVGG